MRGCEPAAVLATEDIWRRNMSIGDMPRLLMTDNGAAMRADESANYLAALDIVHLATLPDSLGAYGQALVLATLVA